MSTLSIRSTVYLDSTLHQALRIKSEETSRSMSELINEAVKQFLSEDAEDILAFKERSHEPVISYDQAHPPVLQ